MELAEVERALRRADEYFLEDGLWEAVVGLWMALTVALPLFIGGVAANWSPVVMLLGGLVLWPAVRAAKRRWVYPRTGSVTYLETPTLRPLVSLGLSREAALAEEQAGHARTRLWASLLFGAGFAVLIPLLMGVSRHLGHSPNLVGHVSLSVAFAGFLVFGAVRWRQRRWIAVAVVVILVGVLAAFDGWEQERALAVHSAGLATAIAASGTYAFVAYRRRTARLLSGGDRDGR